MTDNTSSFSLSAVFCRFNSVIVLESTQRQTLIGIVNPNDEVLRRRIASSFHLFNMREGNTESLLEFVAISRSEFDRLLSHMLSNTGYKAIQDKNCNDGVVVDAKANEDSPAVNVLNSLLYDALVLKASDIHMEPLVTGGLLIRLRKGGFLTEHARFPSSIAESLGYRIKLLSNMNILEKRRPQDGHFTFLYEDGKKKVDIRVSVIPVLHGESIVLRLLDENSVSLDLDKLGFTPSQVELLKKGAALENNLILVCGPTGAGKSTTLSSLMVYIRDYWNNTRKIISMEDPVEYVIDSVTQIQIDNKMELDFEETLRRVFRQDPDVLMIGEIRDRVSAEAAVRAALSGHLVMATLHASSTTEAIVRLLDLEIEPYVLCSVLRLIVSQRLLPLPEGKRVLQAETLWVTDELEKAVMNHSSKVGLEQLIKQLN